jgi:hypothetical protein
MLGKLRHTTYEAGKAEANENGKHDQNVLIKVHLLFSKKRSPVQSNVSLNRGSRNLASQLSWQEEILSGSSGKCNANCFKQLNRS